MNCYLYIRHSSSFLRIHYKKKRKEVHVQRQDKSIRKHNRNVVGSTQTQHISMFSRETYHFIMFMEGSKTFLSHSLQVSLDADHKTLNAHLHSYVDNTSYYIVKTRRLNAVGLLQCNNITKYLYSKRV